MGSGNMFGGYNIMGGGNMTGEYNSMNGGNMMGGMIMVGYMISWMGMDGHIMGGIVMVENMMSGMLMGGNMMDRMRMRHSVSFGNNQEKKWEGKIFYILTCLPPPSEL